MKKIAMLCSGTELYGVGSVLKIYAKEMPNIIFICMSRGVMYDWLIKNNNNVMLLESNYSFVVKTTIGALIRFPVLFVKSWLLSKKIRKIIDEDKIDILHCHWLPHQILAGFVRSEKLKVIWHIHNNMSHSRLFGLSRQLNLLLARWGSDVIISVSEFIGRNWIAAGKPVYIVRNGVYPLYKRPNNPKNSIIKCVIAGRLCEDKGHHLAITAVINAHYYGYKVSLDIYGGPTENNPYYDKIYQQIVTNNLQDYIKFMGFRNDLRVNHQNYDLGLQCRIEPEPCGVWICEALVDGLPLLASATGGTPELMRDNITGLLFRGNNQEDFNQKLIQLIGDKQVLLSMRDTTFKRGQKYFTVKRFIDETKKIYNLL